MLPAPSPLVNDIRCPSNTKLGTTQSLAPPQPLKSRHCPLGLLLPVRVGPEQLKKKAAAHGI
jgi:hypothetical protein